MKKNKKSKGLIAGLTVLVCVSILCGGSLLKNNSENKSRNSNSSRDGIEYFSYKTASALLKNKTKNACYSPISLYCALAVMAKGSDNSGARDIMNLVGVSSKEELNKQYNQLYERIKSMDNLNMANSIWLNTNEKHMGKNTVFREDFKTSINNNFETSLFTLDFDKSNTKSKMGDWVKDKSKGTIKSDFKNTDKSDILIMNAVYFNSKWKDKMTSIDNDRVFHTKSGDIKTDYMIQIDEDGTFTEGDNYTRASLSFENNSKMVFILPNKGVNVSELLKDESTLEKISTEKNDTKCEIDWSIPKFETNSDYDLLKLIKSLGGNKSFGNKWNCKAMCLKSNSSKMEIKKIIQQTHIDVNDKGAEASALTKIELYETAMCDESEIKRKEMNLDRPFIYEIVSDSGDILFIGVCNNPTI